MRFSVKRISLIAAALFGGSMILAAAEYAGKANLDKWSFLIEKYGSRQN